MGQTGNLTDMNYMDAFRGSFAWLNKVSWIGKYLNMFISIFCFFGMFFLLTQVVFTLVFFCNKEMFRTVHEIKSQQSGKVLGMGKQTVEKFISGDLGKSHVSGADTIVHLFYLLCPDMIMYSDYNPDTIDPALDENDNILRWFLITFPKRALLMFFLAATFKGYTMQAYGTVVDAASVVAERIVHYNLAGWVDGLLNTGSNYKFSFGETGKPDDELRQGVAKDLYGYAIGKLSSQDTDSRLTVGKAVDQTVSAQFTDDNIKSYLKDKMNQDVKNDKDWEYIKYSIVVNTASSASNGITIPFTSLGINNGKGKPMYAHVYFNMKDHDSDTNYFTVTPDGNGQTGASELTN